MKIKNRELLNFVNSQLGNRHFPIKLMFAISANAVEADNKIKAYEKTKNELINEYSKKDENGDPISEGGTYVFEDQAKWEESILELLDAEVEMDITTVMIEDVAKCDEPGFDTLTVNELSAIKFMIEN